MTNGIPKGSWVAMTVPLNPSDPGCGKTIKSGHFLGERRRRDFAH